MLQWGLHALIPATRLIPGRWAGLGVLPIGVGLAVMLAADRQFKAAGTAISPFDRPSIFVTTGCFSVSRNPMYLGMLLILVGAAIAWGTVTPWIVPPMFALVLRRRFIAMEERILGQEFGAAYDEYRLRVRRWI